MTDRETAIAAMVEHGDEVGDRAAETAIARLEATGDLDADEREAVKALADRLVAGLLTPPVSGIATGEDEAVAAAMELFGEEDADSLSSAADPAAAGD